MDYKNKYIKYKIKYFELKNMDQNILFGGGKKIIDSIKYKLTPTLEEIKGNRQVTIKMVISNCDKKEQNIIKWINTENILFSGIESYIIKN